MDQESGGEGENDREQAVDGGMYTAIIRYKETIGVVSNLLLTD